MSELTVGSLSGLAANSYVIDVASGSTLDLSAGAVLPAGSIVQVLQAVKTDAFTTTSGSHTPITGLSQAITPSSVTSKIKVSGSLSVHAGGNAGVELIVRRDGTEIFSGTSGSAGNGFFSGNIVSAGIGNNMAVPVSFEFLDSPATTSSVTYDIAVLVTAGVTVYINQSSSTNYGGSASITVMEVAG